MNTVPSRTQAAKTQADAGEFAAVSDETYLDYAIRWRTGQAQSGRHAARSAGIGGHFRAYRPFWQMPDAARIDVRRSITDPFGALMVRQTEDRAAISLVLVADMSASMRAAPGSANAASMLRLAEAAARSAQRAGDRFGMLAFDGAARQDLVLPPTRSKGAAAAFFARFTAAQCGPSSAGLSDIAAHLPARRCLLLLASDFLMPPHILERALETLARHDVAPIVFHEAREAVLPNAGLLRIADAETGRRRLLWLRPALRRRWMEARAARRQLLDALFLRFARPTFHVDGALDLARLGEHLRSV